MAWRKQYWIVQHDAMSNPIWIIQSKEGVRSISNENVWGPYYDEREAANFADSMSYNNPGYPFVVCSSMYAYQFSSSISRKINGESEQG